MPQFRTPQGAIVVIPDDQADSAEASGYKPVGIDRAGSVNSARDSEDRGVLGGVNAAATGLLSGATLGGSDYLLKGLLDKGQFERLAAEREGHPIAAGIGQVTGAIIPAIAAPESLLGRLPSGIVGRATAEAVAEGRAIGGASGVARQLVASGAEGAIQNAGMYISDTALGDRELSAEGLAASLGPGFAFGVGGGAAALGVEQGTIAARRLFSRAAGTDKAAEAAQSAWKAQYQSHVETTDAAADIARAKLAEAKTMREQAQLAKQRAKLNVVETEQDAPQLDATYKAAEVEREQVRDAAKEAWDSRAAQAPQAATPEPVIDQHTREGLYGFGITDADFAAASPAERAEALRLVREADAEMAMNRIKVDTPDRPPLTPASEKELTAAVAEHDAARAELDDVLRRLDIPDLEPGVYPSHVVPINEFGALEERAGLGTPGPHEPAKIPVTGEHPPPPFASQDPTRQMNHDELGLTFDPKTRSYLKGEAPAVADVGQMSREQLSAHMGALDEQLGKVASGSPEHKTLSDQWDAAVARRRALEDVGESAKSTPAEPIQRGRASTDPTARIFGENKVSPTFTEPKGELRLGLDSKSGEVGHLWAMKDEQGLYRIKYTNVDNDFRGRGLANAMYREMNDEMLKRFGQPLMSDYARSPTAERVWEGLEKAGLADRKFNGINVKAGDPRPDWWEMKREGGSPGSRSLVNEVPNDIENGGHPAIAGADTNRPVTEEEYAGLKSTLKKSLTSDERAAAIDYSADPQSRNGALRQGQAIQSGEQSKFAQLDSLIAKSPAPRDMRLYRGLDDKAAGTWRDLKPGDRVTDPGYSSTSSEYVVARYRDAADAAGEVIGTRGSEAMTLAIDVPKGYPAAAIPSVASDNEILLRRGTALEVVSQHMTEDGHLIVRARVVPSEMRPLSARGGGIEVQRGAATDTLTGQMRSMQSQLGAGADLKTMGAPARAEYAAAKAEKATAAAEHFRAQANAKNYATSPMAADDQSAFFANLTRPKSRDAYVAQNIGRAMREEGSHAQALAKVEREWAEQSGHPISTKAIPDAVEDIAAVAHIATKYEKASARLAEALGPEAPPAAQEAAKAFRAAEDYAERKTMDRTTRAIDDHVDSQGRPRDAFYMGRKVSEAKIAEAEAARVGRQPAPAPARPSFEDLEAKYGKYSGQPALPPTSKEALSAAKSAHGAADVSLQRARIGETEAKIGARGAEDFATKARAAAEAVRPTAPAARPTSTLGAIATTIGVAGELGVPGIPHPHDIPVIGPLLGTYLKYRAIKAAAGRFVGRIPATGDARAAALVARAKDKIATAVDRTLGLAEKMAPKARGALVATSTALGHRLIDDGEPDAPKGSNAQQQAAVRIREIANAATQPELVTAMVRKEMRGVADPDLIAAAEQHLMARFEALNKVAPKAPPPNPYSKREWVPSQAAAHDLAQRLAVVHDPEAAFHDTTPAKAQTLRDAWPRLLEFAQQRLIERVGDLKHPVAYEDRLRNSLLFSVPLDDSMQPDHAAVLQSAHVAPAPLQPPQSPSGPTPSIAGNSNLTALYQTGSDRRAMR